MEPHAPRKSLDKDATVADVKTALAYCDGRTPSWHEGARKEMLKYIRNECPIGEGSEWLHGDEVVWKRVSKEAYNESSSFRPMLTNCWVIWQKRW